jgi:hypothetical protein
MRWTTQPNQPTIDAEWDNDGLVTAGVYSSFEMNKELLLDSAGKGSFDPAFNPSLAGNIRATWVQYRVTLLEGLS